MMVRYLNFTVVWRLESYKTIPLFAKSPFCFSGFLATTTDHHSRLVVFLVIDSTLARMYPQSFATATVCFSKLASGVPVPNDDDSDIDRTISQVALFSVDGFYSSDVSKWVAQKPNGAIASLLNTSYRYFGALSSGPSDSFPGVTNLVAGASPSLSGIWYDDAYGKLYILPFQQTRWHTITKTARSLRLSLAVYGTSCVL